MMLSLSSFTSPSGFSAQGKAGVISPASASPQFAGRVLSKTLNPDQAIQLQDLFVTLAKASPENVTITIYNDKKKPGFLTAFLCKMPPLNLGEDPGHSEPVAENESLPFPDLFKDSKNPSPSIKILDQTENQTPREFITSLFQFFEPLTK